MPSLPDSICELAAQWSSLNWDFRDRDVGGRVEKVSQWQGDPAEDVMVVVFEGPEITEPFHRQDFFFLDYAYRGSYDVLSSEEDNLVAIDEGDCYVGQPYSGYALRGRGGSSNIVMIGVHIKRDVFFREYLATFSSDPEMFRFFLEPEKDRFSDEFIHLHLDEGSQARTLLELMVVEYAQKGHDTQGILKSLLMSLLLYVAREHRAREPRDGVPSERDRIVEYVTAHCESVTLGEVAERFSYHPNYVSSMLHREYGVTFSELVLRGRMERAAALLRATSLSNEEVAAMVGYGNASNFYKAFRRHFGMTPLEMREGFTSHAAPGS